jgi:hypothetical protein
MKDEAVYTVLTVLGICAIVIAVTGTALILGSVIAGWAGLALGAVL